MKHKKMNKKNLRYVHCWSISVNRKRFSIIFAKYLFENMIFLNLNFTDFLYIFYPLDYFQGITILTITSRGRGWGTQNLVVRFFCVSSLIELVHQRSREGVSFNKMLAKC